MPNFTIYHNTAQLRHAIGDWLLAGPASASAMPKAVEVCGIRLKIEVTSAGTDIWVRVREVPFWQMTARQVCNAIKRVLLQPLCRIVPYGCRFAEIRQQLFAGLPEDIRHSIAHFNQSWWSVEAICAAWKSGLASMANGESRTIVSALPRFLGLRIGKEQLEAVWEPINALLVKGDWTGVLWDDIQPVLLLLYSISSDANGPDVRDFRDKAFCDLFTAASERLGFTVETALHLLQSIALLPSQPELLRHVCCIAESVVLQSADSWRVRCWPKLNAVDCESLEVQPKQEAEPEEFEHVKNLFALTQLIKGGGALSDECPVKVKQAKCALHLIADAPYWSGDQANILRSTMRKIDAALTGGTKPSEAVSARRWPSRKSPADPSCDVLAFVY